MFSHLLIPLDGSEMAEAALAPAKALAEKFGSKMTLVRIIDLPRARQMAQASSRDTLLDDIRREQFAEASGYMKGKLAELMMEGVDVRTQLVESDAAAMAILETVEKLGVTTVVMSTHGRGGLTRLIFGSVAEKVLRQCTIPVVLIRNSEPA